MSTITEVGQTDGAEVAQSRRWRRIVIAIGVAIAAALLLGAGALYAWDAGYDARILPGVRVGTTDVSGMDRASATAAVTAAYPYGDGRLILRGPDGDVAIAYAAAGRRAAVDAVVDRALNAGRNGGIVERAIAEVRLALDGLTLEPGIVIDEAALERLAVDALRPLDRAATDATITMSDDGEIVVTDAVIGRTVDAASAVRAAVTALGSPEAPSEVVIPVTATAVQPAVGDAVVEDARAAALTMARDLEIGTKSRSWTIRATRIRTWIRFEPGPAGTIVPVVDPAKIPAVFGKSIAKAVKRAPSSAQYLRSRAGTIVGVVASSTGRKLDTAATTRAVVAALEARAAGVAAEPVAIKTAVVLPRLATEEAAKKAPVMTLLGSWRTWFPISDRNFNGANIWVPAKLINGTVLKPGRTFDWWNAIWPVTPARGFGPGGIIRVDHTEPTGALGGGMCSSSTTLFNAAMRAGLDMGARSNHRYYINRYPLGLDATVSIIRGGRQTMSFTNDMKHSIFIRGIRTRAGRVGYVTYEIWGIPDGRTVSLSRPSVRNVRKATTTTVLVDTLAPGEKNQVEYPSDGMDVSVTRVVRNARGGVIHRNTWVSHYVLWNGRIEVGR